MKSEFEQDYLELACRMYEAWKISQKTTAIETITRVTDRAVNRNICKAFILLNERTENNPELRRYGRPLTGFFPGKQTTSKPRKPMNSHSPGLEASPDTVPQSMKLLRSATTTSTLLKDIYTAKPSSPTLRTGISRLYEDHIHRKIKQAARKEAKSAAEAQNLTFTPVVNSTNLPPKTRIPVFERLTYDTRPNISMSSEEKEYLSASFTPSLTSKQYILEPVSAEKMHNRAEITAKKIRKMQMEAQVREIQGCSFAPKSRNSYLSHSSSFSSTASSKSIFDRLYQVFSN